MSNNIEWDCIQQDDSKFTSRLKVYGGYLYLHGRHDLSGEFCTLPTAMTMDDKQSLYMTMDDKQSL